MCDCAEARRKELERCAKCCGPPEDDAPSTPNNNRRMLLALSTLLLGFLVYMLYSLDRRTIRKILTMLGLGFLFASETKAGGTCPPPKKPCTPTPQPCSKKPDPPKDDCGVPPTPPKDCLCKDPPPPPPCKVPPTLPPSCKKPEPPKSEGKGCACCPKS